ncbi:MAG: helix-turn-helix domain-containing protein [Agriterribacter sp.]
MTDAEIIKTIREQRGLTQREITAELEVGRTTISSIESGRNPIYWDLVKKLVEKMDVNPYFLMGQSETMFLSGTNEIQALRKKVREYEKHIDKMMKIRNANGG